jgi:outer membrane protein assembly factor BamB
VDGDIGFFSKCVVANDLVFVNSFSRLYALSAANGEFLWSAGLRTNDFASPAVANGIVYLGSTNGRLYAFSVNGELPAAPLGVKPALSSLKPDLSLKPVRTPED